MANSYLFRNFTSAGNKKTFTFSAWVKFADDTSISTLFATGADSENRLIFIRHDSGSGSALKVDGKTSTNQTIEVRTNRAFRDTNAWYHIVLRVDTTQSTAADRVRIYVNGVQETSFAQSTYPSQNYDTEVNKTANHMVGRYSYSASNYMNGYMSHVAFVDGASLAPTSFGQTDSTSGIWKFKSPSGITWGTNGFHLKFENSGNLGLDSSSNTANWTSQGNLKQSKSTPSNVISTINAKDNTITTGDAKATFTDAGTTVQTGNTPYTASTSSYGVTKGKWYAEFKYTAKGQTDAAILGVVGKIFAANAAIGTVSESYSYYVNGNKYVASGSATSYGSTWTLNDIIGIALDVDNSKLYFSKNGTWQDSGDPTSGSTGTGAISIAAVDTVEAGAYFMAVGDFGNPTTTYATWKPNFGEGKFGQDAVASAGTSSSGDDSVWEYDCPANYYGLNTKNINTYG
tara:strand:- start:278 stop:1651 length:1374 start_codon:yes stop_codon:yes gene_type:complete